MKIYLSILSLISVLGAGSILAANLDQIKAPVKHTVTVNAKSMVADSSKTQEKPQAKQRSKE